jgi:hypothetical protein
VSPGPLIVDELVGQFRCFCIQSVFAMHASCCVARDGDGNLLLLRAYVGGSA